MTPYESTLAALDAAETFTKEAANELKRLEAEVGEFVESTFESLKKADLHNDVDVWSAILTAACETFEKSAQPQVGPTNEAAMAAGHQVGPTVENARMMEENKRRLLQSRAGEPLRKPAPASVARAAAPAGSVPPPKDIALREGAGANPMPAGVRGAPDAGMLDRFQGIKNRAAKYFDPLMSKFPRLGGAAAGMAAASPAALLGGGAGALGGLLYTLLRKPDEQGKKHYLRNMMMGGLMGGAPAMLAGGGVGAMRPYEMEAGVRNLV
jgi:hypothetical protein